MHPAGSIVSKVKDVIVDFLPSQIMRLFKCSEGSVWMCLLKNVLDVLQWLLLFMMKNLDYLKRALAGIVGIPISTLSLASCVSCSLTTIAVEVLADFTRDFSLDACQAIVDVGKTGCAAANVPQGPVGAGVFNGVWGVMKLVLGLAKHALPLAEVTWAVVKIVFETAIDLFPNIVADAADLLAFALTMSDAAVKLALLYAAVLDPAFDDVSGSIKTEMYTAGGAPVTPVAVPVAVQSAVGVCPGDSNVHGNCSAGIGEVRSRLWQLTHRLVMSGRREVDGDVGRARRRGIRRHSWMRVRRRPHSV